MKRKLIPLPGILLIFSLVIVFGFKVHAQSAPSAALTLLADRTNVLVGDIVLIKVGIETPVNVQGIDVIIQFDPNVFKPTEVSAGNTNLKTLAPTNDGIFDLTKAVSGQELEIAAVAYDWNTDQTTAGISGTLDNIFTIQFEALATGSGNFSLKYTSAGNTLDSNIVTNDNGQVRDIMAIPADPIQVRVGPICNAQFDFDSDNRFTILDILQVAGKWNSRSGDAIYDARMDIDSDSDIDIIDLLRTASHWGQTCN